MPVIAPPPQDELLRLSGSTGNAFETITTTANGTGAYYGPDRTVSFWLIIAGAVTGTSPTLDIKLQDSADGSSYTDLGVAFPQQTTSMASAVGNLADFPRVTVTTKPGRGYLRIVKTAGGTSPSFSSVAVLHEAARPF
jgi:hypothetical protein